VVSGDQTLADMKNYSLDRNRAIDKFCRMSSPLLGKEDAAKIAQTIFQLPDMSNLNELSQMFKKTKVQ